MWQDSCLLRPHRALMRGPVIDQEALAVLCRRWQIVEVALFGSVLREDFGNQSDVDLLVTFGPDARWSLLDHERARQDFARLLGRSVDLVDRAGVEASSNWIRREHILSHAERIYAAA